MYQQTIHLLGEKATTSAKLPAIDGEAFSLHINEGFTEIWAMSLDPAVAARFFGDLAVAALHLSEAAQAKLADDALEAEASA